MSDLKANCRVTANNKPMKPDKNPLIITFTIFRFWILAWISASAIIAASDGVKIASVANSAPAVAAT